MHLCETPALALLPCRNRGWGTTRSLPCPHGQARVAAAARGCAGTGLQWGSPWGWARAEAHATSLEGKMCQACGAIRRLFYTGETMGLCLLSSISRAQHVYLCKVSGRCRSVKHSSAPGAAPPAREKPGRVTQGRAASRKSFPHLTCPGISQESL